MGAGLHFINGGNEKLILVDTEVNMTYSNTNAVLVALGLPQLDEDGCLFDLPVADLAEACRLFLTSELSMVVDNGTPTVQEGNVILCGRREGYITERINQIKFACEEARSKGATHAYFA